MNVSFSYTKPPPAVSAPARPEIKASVGGQMSFTGPAQALGRGLGGQGGFTNWPAILDAPNAANARSRDDVVARARDLVRNDPQVKGGVNIKADMVIGAGFIFQANIDHRALGITRAQAKYVNRALMQVFNDWAYDPHLGSDARELQGFGLQTRSAFLQRVTTGDGLGVLRFNPFRPGVRTAVQLVDSDRLSTPNGMQDGPAMCQGIEIDASTGRPLIYYFRNAHPADATARGGGFTWTRVPRRAPSGRPIVLHMFDPERPDSVRGFSDLVAGLSAHGMVNGYASSELKNAAANALYLGVITSNGDPLQLAADLGVEDKWSVERFGEAYDAINLSRDNYYGGAFVKDDVRFARLAPGDNLSFATTPRQTDFKSFKASFDHGFAAALGISFEQYTRDFSGVSYSGIRASLNEVWRGVPRLRQELNEMWLRPVWLAVLEDAMDSGLLQEKLDLVTRQDGAAPINLANLPTIWEAKRGWTDSRWIGPGPGVIDATKEQEAADARFHGGMSSLSEEAAAQGKPLEMVLAERQADAEMFGEYGQQVPTRVEGGAPQLPVRSQSNAQIDTAENGQKV
jgi:lambda family phage portal protein